MNKLFSLIFLFCPLVVSAQYSVEGKVMDTSKQILPSASIVILQQSDSTLVNFGLSNEKGEFQINLQEKGKYVIQYSFLGYQTILTPIETSWEEKKISLKPIIMKPSEFKLSEVSITADRIPLQLKGDTLVYDAAAFKTRAGDDVEKLLELFPGISIDSEGNLIAQGKIVDKVLVNGKEFFGKNIDMATKNLEAKMVKKVEVFDKKSEDAEFTGIDDGKEKRTINLELKEAYKKGSFGRLEAALGNEETFAGRANYNRFNETTQSSFIGNVNNINQRPYQSIAKLSPNSGGQGITTAGNTGLNISKDFSSSISSSFNYSFLKNNTTIENKVLSQNFTDTSIFQTDQLSDNESDRIEHRFNGRVKWKINESTETALMTRVNLSDHKLLNNSSTLYDPPLNGSLVESNLNQENDQLDFSTDLDFRKRFTKKGRTWLNGVHFDKIEKKEDIELFNSTFGAQLNQVQTFDETSITSDFNSTYTEPINEQWFVKTNYTYNYEINEPTRSFFDLENSSARFNDSLSSNFQRILNVHDVELSINKNTKKLTSSAGVNAIETNLRSSKLDRYFRFLLPFLNVNYRITPSKSIRFSYLTQSRAPQLSQLITISNNTNPNQNYIGNPNLNPEYNHTFQINFYNFNINNQLSYNVGLSFNKTLDKIINQTFVNENFTSSTSPINTDFYESFNLNSGISGKIQPINMRYRLNARASLNNYDAFLNGEISKVQNQIYATRLILSRAKKEKWDISVGMDYSLNLSAFEVNSNFNQQSSNFYWFAKGELEIIKSLTLEANYRIQRLNNVEFFSGRILHFVNASLKKEFKDGKWETFLLVNDLLNQNIGVQRSSTINSLSEQTYNTRQQYFMIGVSKKIGARKNQED